MPKFNYSHVCISNLVFQVDNKIIDLSPPYQRGDVWTMTDRENLIASIIGKSYPIPSISMATNPRNLGTNESEVLDGRQRLTTLSMFRNSHFRYNGRFYSEMSIREQQYFDITQIQLCTIDNPTDAERRDYFRTLQMGHTLRVTEIAWSYDDHPVMKMIQKIRSEKLKEIGSFTATGRYADMTILINMYDIFTSSNPKTAGRLHSSALKVYIEKNTDVPHPDVEYRMHTFINFMHAIYGITQPIDKGSVRAHFPLDMARIFALDDFKCDERDVLNVASFIDKMNTFVHQYNDGGADDTNEVADEYFYCLVDITTSSSYTKRNVDSRMSHLMRLF
jgi:hypothetical protein